MPTQREYEDIFKKVFLFSDLINVPEAFDRISAIMERREFSKGDIITQQGQPGNEFFVLVRGQLSVHKNTLEGDDYKVALLESGYPAFGEGGLIDGEVRSATIICDSQAECLVLKKEKFDHLCQAEPQIGLPIFKRISQLLLKRLNQTSNDVMMLHKALMDEVRSQ